MTLGEKVNSNQQLIEIIDEKIKVAEKESKKHERNMLVVTKNKEHRINWYIAISTVDKLKELKLLLLKDSVENVKKVKEMKA